MITRKIFKVFIIDDDVSVMELFKHILEVDDIHTSVAYNDEEVMKKIPEIKPDLMIIDLMMPKKGGFHLLKELQQDEIAKSIPVIVVSGKFVDGTTSDFLQQQPNVRGFYTKPIDPVGFMLGVRKVLGGESV
ncbi:MAG: response regulator [Elusimicrobia bacterium]|nr:response regulator [Elusimicrobiota bacterium]